MDEKSAGRSRHHISHCISPTASTMEEDALLNDAFALLSKANELDFSDSK